MKIGFIGTGSIAEPMIRSLVRQFPNADIAVSQRSASVSSRLANEFAQVNVQTNTQGVVDSSDIVVLSMLASVGREVLPALTFRDDQSLISVMVDYPLADLGRDCAPVQDIAITIPLPFIETGGCPLAYYPESEALVKLFGTENPLIMVADENALLPFISVTGSVGSIVQSMQTIAAWLDDCVGHPQDSEAFVLQLFSRYLQALPADGKQRFQEVLDQLSTTGGLNLQMVGEMEERGHFNDIETGLNSLNRRLGFSKE